jgi:hypothetical protein
MTEREQGIVLLVPLAAILFIPLAGHGGVSSRLGAIFIELLVGLPGLMLVPAVLRPAVYPVHGRIPPWLLAPLLLSLAIAFQLIYQVLGQVLPCPIPTWCWCGSPSRPIPGWNPGCWRCP